MKKVTTENNNIFYTPRQITVSDKYGTDVDVVLFDRDCSELLKCMPAESVDLVITSPPYNESIYHPTQKLRPYLFTHNSPYRVYQITQKK